MHDIFVSYSQEDHERAAQIAHVLEGHGWSVWWAPRIRTGHTFDEVIEKAIDASKCVIVLWSKSSVPSRWVRTEAQEGMDRDVLVPILIDDVKIPLAFRLVQAANLVGWDGRETAPALQSLLGDIESLVGLPKSTEPDPIAAEKSATSASSTLATSGPGTEAVQQPGPSVPRPPPTVRAEQHRGSQPKPKLPDWVKPVSIGAIGVMMAVIGWQILGSAPTPEPRIDDFRTSAESIAEGESVTLTWFAAESDSVVLQPGGRQASAASITVSPSQDTEYVLAAYGSGGEARRTVEIQVARPVTAALDTAATPAEKAPPVEESTEPRIAAFRASTTSITEGDEVTLTWSTIDAERVDLRPGGPVALNGSTVLSPGQSTTYELVAAGPGGETQQSVRVSVDPLKEDRDPFEPPQFDSRVGQISVGNQSLYEFEVSLYHPAAPDRVFGMACPRSQYQGL
jgi:hypothetical protein